MVKGGCSPSKVKFREEGKAIFTLHTQTGSSKNPFLLFFLNLFYLPYM